MTAEIVTLDGMLIGSGRKLEPDTILEEAKGRLSECIVLGVEDGALYAASTDGAPDTLWLIERCKAWILNGCPAEDNAA